MKGAAQLIGLSLLVVACGQNASTDVTDPSDAASVQEAAAATTDGESPNIVGPLNLFNNGCLHTSLPLNAAGMLSCRALLAGVKAGCAQDGLSPARPSDVAAIDAYGAAHPVDVPAPPVCEMKQLSPEVNCSTESVLGWCYFHGACVADAGRVCAQEICASGGFGSMFIIDNHYGNFDSAWLVCP